MFLHTQFTSRDRVPGLEGCYLIEGTFSIGNLTPRPINLVFAYRFFHTKVIGVFLFLLGFHLYKITTKSKWRLQRKTVLLEDGFSKLENQRTFFLSFKSESRRHVDRVMVHKLATPMGIEPRISGFIRGSNLNLNGVYWSTWFSDR